MVKIQDVIYELEKSIQLHLPDSPYAHQVARNLKHWLIQVSGYEFLSDVTEEKLNNLYSSMKEQGKSDITISVLQGNVRRLFRFAMEQGWTDHSPSTSSRGRKKSPSAKPQQLILNEVKLEQLKEKAASTPYPEILQGMMELHLPLPYILALRPQDYDREFSRLIVSVKLNANQDLIPCKQIRAIPLDQEQCIFLDTLISRSADRLFADPSGNVPTTENVERWLETLRTELDLPGLTVAALPNIVLGAESEECHEAN